MTSSNFDEDSFDPAAPAAPGSGIFGMSRKAEDCLVHLIPVPFQATTSYGQGTAHGPAAILTASHQPDLFDIECGRPYESGIVLLPHVDELHDLNASAEEAAEIFHEGGEGAEAALEQVNLAGERVNALVRREAKKSLAAGKLVGLVGGDHASPFGLIEELSFRHPGMGIFHIDAHHDLRHAYEGFIWSHASIMFNVMTQLDSIAKLVQVGIRDFSEEEKQMADESEGLIKTFYDRDFSNAQFSGTPFDTIAGKAIGELPKKVYISFDIDGLDPKLCPNTGTPVPGGFDFNQAMRLISLITESGRTIVGFDLCEVAPGHDEWDANVGARVLYRLIGHMIMSQP
ncbi:MAG: agmatinase [Planctomycetota bacterium]|jgi:agmatinase